MVCSYEVASASARIEGQEVPRAGPRAGAKGKRPRAEGHRKVVEAESAAVEASCHCVCDYLVLVQEAKDWRGGFRRSGALAALVCGLSNGS